MSTDLSPAALQHRLEEERMRLAREVHDALGGTLAALRFDLGWLKRHGARGDSSASAHEPAVREHIDSALASLDLAIDATHRIVRDLRTPELDHGLVPAIERLVHAFEQRSGIATTFEASSDSIEASDAVLLTLYRTAQEALTNIGKHGLGATRASVRLHRHAGRIELTIEDDGPGLAPDSLGKPEAFGLRGLQERAAAVGGSLQVIDRGDASAHGVMLQLAVDAMPPPEVGSAA